MTYITSEALQLLRCAGIQWQRAALGLLALSAAVNAVQFAAVRSSRQLAADWEAKYQMAAAVEGEALEAYGRLVRKTERERLARAEQAAAYEAAGAWEYIGECVITAYCPCGECCGRWADGVTAAGLPAGPGIVAVDPAVIPLGSTVIIDGQRYLAADTGVTGNHVDVCLTSHEETVAFGVQAAEVWVSRE